MVQTNLGTLGRVLNLLREAGIPDIPETDDAFELAMTIVLEVEVDTLKQILIVISGAEKDFSDEEGVKILENFFSSLGENLSVFVNKLTRESREQKVMAIQNLQTMMEENIQEIITSTGIDSLLKEDLVKFSTN